MMCSAFTSVSRGILGSGVIVRGGVSELAKVKAIGGTASESALAFEDTAQ